MTDRSHTTVSEPVAWAIVDNLGVAGQIRWRKVNFFGFVVDSALPTAEEASAMDTALPKCAPHRIVALYTHPPSERVRELNSFSREDVEKAIETSCLQRIFKPLVLSVFWQHLESHRDERLSAIAAEGLKEGG